LHKNIQSIVLIQARLSSNRLPAKAILPINKLPIVVLASLRAGNTGKKVRVVTSIDQGDDLIESELREREIDFYRGSLNNVLQRFVESIDGYDDSALVFRLTADNIFPDGKLLDDMENYYLQNDCEYLVCNGESSNAPYGVSVELFRAQHLRESLKKVKSDYDLEHVTPFLARNFKKSFFTFNSSKKFSNYRATIDTFNDYLLISQVFKGFIDPINVPVYDLVAELAKCSKNVLECNTSKFVLGCAQLGMKYGITNKNSQPSNQESLKILATAIDNNVAFLDTAMDYGTSETVIGNFLASTNTHHRTSVITKLSKAKDFLENCHQEQIHKIILSKVENSCYKLNTKKIDYLLIHNFDDINYMNGEVFKVLNKLVNQGIIGSLGASIQSEEELDKALEISEIKLIQMPFNILDTRWNKLIEKIKLMKSKRNLIIHVRSVFLQGLLLSDDEDHWKKANINDGKKIISLLRGILERTNYISMAELCINYVRSQNWVDGILIGVNEENELIANLQTFSNKLRGNEFFEKLLEDLPKFDDTTLNPAFWNVNE